MKANPEKLSVADCVIRWSYMPLGSKNLTHHNRDAMKTLAPLMSLLRDKIRQARRFHLDKTFFSGLDGNTQRAMRDITGKCDLAHLPYDTVWLEFQTEDRYAGLYVKAEPQKELCTHTAFLLERFVPGDPSKWRATKFHLSVKEADIAMPICTASIIFGAEAGYNALSDNPEFARHLRDVSAALWGFVLPDPSGEGTISYVPEAIEHRAAVVGDKFFCAPLMRHIEAHGQDLEGFLDTTIRRDIRFLRSEANFLVNALAMINYTPVTYKEVPSPGHYEYKLRNLPYLAHSVITLNVAQDQVVDFVRNALKHAAARKRAHDVRGHWRHYKTPFVCAQYEIHTWEKQADRDTCTRCQTFRTWIPEHVRGDATLGWVKHDYEVVA
jgi:hypothetical protein